MQHKTLIGLLSFFLSLFSMSPLYMNQPKCQALFNHHEQHHNGLSSESNTIGRHIEPVLPNDRIHQEEGKTSPNHDNQGGWQVWSDAALERADNGWQGGPMNEGEP